MANATELVKLSASTKGKRIKVAATATAGTPIHVTSNHATKVDRLYLNAYNGHTADVVLTVEFGGVTVPDDTIVLTIPFKSGLTIVVDGDPLIDAAGGALTVAAFAGTANVITIGGHVLRVLP